MGVRHILARRSGAALGAPILITGSGADFTRSEPRMFNGRIKGDFVHSGEACS